MTTIDGRIENLRKSAFFEKSSFAEGFFDRIEGVERWELLASRFRSFSENQVRRPAASIPKIIHQIWIGKSVPNIYREWMFGWKAKHPEWEYRLWDEKSILKFGLRNEEAFRKTASYGAKSDIARYEILERFGGVYVDTDFECLRSLNELNDHCSFYAGTIFGNSPVINNGLIGAIREHPLLCIAIDGLSKPVRTKDGMKILELTGPGYFTEVFFKGIGGLDESCIIFPSSYFYPVPNFAMDDLATLTRRRPYLKEWSYAIHYWEASWLKPSRVRVLLSRGKRMIFKLVGKK